MKILLVGDEEERCVMLKDELSRLRHEVQAVRNRQEALALFEAERFDLVLIDLGARGSAETATLADAFEKARPETMVVDLSRLSQSTVVLSVSGQAARKYFMNPRDILPVQAVLLRVLSKKSDQPAP